MLNGDVKSDSLTHRLLPQKKSYWMFNLMLKTNFAI